MTDPRLIVQGLTIDYPTARVVDHLSFTLGNERLALVGESGSGKSMTARALMGLVRRPGVVSAEALNVLGRDALTLRDRGWRGLRGNDIAMVLQDPRYALNPVKSIQAQLEEALTLHQRLSRRARLEAVKATTCRWWPSTASGCWSCIKGKRSMRWRREICRRRRIPTPVRSGPVARPRKLTVRCCRPSTEP